MITDSVVFHSSASAASNGTAYHVSNTTVGTKMYISIANGSGSRVLFFEGLGNTAGSYVPVACTNLSTNGSAISTSGSSDEMWSASIAGYDYFRCRTTVVSSSGSLTVLGKVINEL